MICFENIYKKFGGNKVLEAFNLEIKKGEVFFLLGRSGMGKSVALKLIVGLLKPDTGEIYFQDQALSSFKEKDFRNIRKKCGLIFQNPALLDSRNLYENLSLGIRHLPSKEIMERIEKALWEVKLEDLLKDVLYKKPSQLSQGEQKRLAIARTLVTNPECILYDEPTTGLDPLTSQSIHDLIRSLSQNLSKTALVVSHDMRHALSCADRLAILDKGSIREIGSPQKIRESQIPLLQEFMEES